MACGEQPTAAAIAPMVAGKRSRLKRNVISFSSISVLLNDIGGRTLVWVQPPKEKSENGLKTKVEYTPNDPLGKEVNPERGEEGALR